MTRSGEVQTGRSRRDVLSPQVELWVSSAPTRPARASPRDGVPTALRRALVLVDHAEHASASVRCTSGGVETVASTSPLAAHVDELQRRSGVGPGFEALTTADRYVLADVLADATGPPWTGEAARLGVRVVLSVPLRAESGPVGALSLLSGNPRAFDTRAIQAAVSYADVVSLLLHAEREADHLAVALESRRTIGVAVGIVMTRYGLSAERAFAVLQRYSSHHNTKLRLIAAEVTTHGDLPGPPT